MNGGGSSASSRKDPAEPVPDKPISNPSKVIPGKDLGHRFAPNAEVQGGHEHHLKSSRRQEKLSDMWRSLLGKKPEASPDNDLSLVSNWVDSLRLEKEEAMEKKTGPNPSSTLVEKYGKCHEVVGRGAFGIVRISHKKLGGSEKLFAVKEFRRRPEETGEEVQASASRPSSASRLPCGIRT